MFYFILLCLRNIVLKHSTYYVVNSKQLTFNLFLLLYLSFFTCYVSNIAPKVLISLFYLLRAANQDIEAKNSFVTYFTRMEILIGQKSFFDKLK